MNIKNITTNEYPKFNKQFQNIFNSSKNLLIPTNFEAHKSLKINYNIQIYNQIAQLL